jgi:hypothetical protein
VNPWDVPIGSEHPDHPGWWRQGGDSLIAAFALAESTIVVGIDWFEAQSGVDCVAEMARLVELGEEMHADTLRRQAEATTSDEPRALTAEEMRERFLRHVRTTVEHWGGDALTPMRPSERDAYRRVAEGVAFSIMVALDGGSGGLPAFDLVPSPHPDDEAFHRGEGENWWPAGVVINECQLHDLLWKREG